MSGTTEIQIHKLLAAGERNTSELLSLVYTELRVVAERMMRNERDGHTLQPTALVHEAFLRLADARKVGEQGRLHFLEAAAVTMRRVLVDHARSNKAAKRGGRWNRVTLAGVDPEEQAAEELDLDHLDELLCELEKLDPRQARIVELRFFGDLTGQEIGELLGISRQTVVRELTMARAWLRRGLDGRA